MERIHSKDLPGQQGPKETVLKLKNPTKPEKRILITIIIIIP